MKITIYELLGLIKDGKAPENIKYQDKVYYKGKFSSNIFYFCNDKLERINLTHFDNLNDEVEILDEEDEFIDIKPLVLKTFERTGQAVTIDRLADYYFDNFKLIENALAKVILNQKKIIERLKDGK